MKAVVGVYSAPRPHWVGDGFPARSLFSYGTHGKHMSPFLLLDYAGPYRFDPTEQQRGVGQHPTGDLRPLPSFMRVKSRIGTPPVPAELSVQVMSSG